MPPRFDRDIPNSMHAPHSGVMQNGMICTNSNGANLNGINSNGNGNQLLNGNANTNGGIGNVAASLRKPLLEINGRFKNQFKLSKKKILNLNL